MHRGVSPEEVADLARRYAKAASLPYFERYVPPNNPDRPVNVAIIELVGMRHASLSYEATPRGVRSGWANLRPETLPDAPQSQHRDT
jgi:hypothetical protein